jgi:hypothetical protein
MDILVTESTSGAAEAAAGRLAAAGHRIHWCHEASSPAFPCAGLTSGCPMDDAPIDLVLTVRGHVRTTPAPSEDGVVCGLRRRIPVAIAGHTVMNPYEALGAESVDADDDLVAACERVAASRRPEHEEVARAVVRDTLAIERFPAEPCDVSVRRVAGRLKVQVTVPAVVPQRAREIVAVRVAGRLREFDPNAGGIDIGVTTTGAEQ